MIGSLTELVKTYPENLVVIDNWVEGVFPLILDVEQKAAEKVQEVKIKMYNYYLNHNYLNQIKLLSGKRRYNTRNNLHTFRVFGNSCLGILFRTPTRNLHTILYHGG